MLLNLLMIKFFEKHIQFITDLMQIIIIAKMDAGGIIIFDGPFQDPLNLYHRTHNTMRKPHSQPEIKSTKNKDDKKHNRETDI